MWFLPSRSRPSSLKRFFMHYELTKADSEGVVWIDEDDAHNYDSVEVPAKWVKITSPRKKGGTGALTNAFYNMFPDEPWYGLLADDVIPRTKNWDAKLIEAAGADGVSYGEDGIERFVDGVRHCSHPCVGGDRVRKNGWLALPGCERTYIDDALRESAKRDNKLFFLPDIFIEHMHFSNGKSPMDKTYEKNSVNKDKEIFDAWLQCLI